MEVLITALFVAFVILSGFVYLGTGLWAYYDAMDRGRPGWLAAMVVLLLAWPVGLLVWLVMRPGRRGGNF